MKKVIVYLEPEDVARLDQAVYGEHVKENRSVFIRDLILSELNRLEMLKVAQEGE